MKKNAVVWLLFLLTTSLQLFAQGGSVKITGYVYDGDGNPLDLVNVRVKNSVIASMTNEKGFYSLSVSSQDSLTVLYSCLGYNTAERIIPQAAQDIKLNVRMNPMSLQLGEVSVTATQRQTNTVETIDVEKMRLLPDPSGGTIESLVVTYAGVSTRSELSSQYSVRGGSFEENMVYVNGMEVYRPLLIRSGEQEGLSFVNPDMTENVKFSAGGFEAAYGDKMSSVLDVTYKKPTKFEASVSGSLLGASGYIGSSTGKFTQITGVRYKTNRSLLGTMYTDAEFQPDFVDFQTYMTYELLPTWELNVLGNIALNSYKFTPHSRETSFGTLKKTRKFKVYFDGKERDRFDTYYGAVNLKKKLNDNSEVGLQASAFSSKEEESYDISGEYWLNESGGVSEDGVANEEGSMAVGRYHEHARNRLKSNIVHIGHFGKMRIKQNTVQWGLSAQFEKIADQIGEWESRDSSGYSLPQTGQDVNVIANLFSDNKLSSTRFSGYVQDMFKFRSKQGLFTLVAGIRGSYWDYNQEFLFSPRASLGFIPNFNQNFTFRFASGLYYQSPFYKEVRKEVQDEYGNGVIRLNDKLKSQRSLHFILGGDYQFKVGDRNFKISADMYYKKMDKLNPYTVDNVKIRYYGDNIADGSAYGIDVKLFGEFVPGTDSWISFSLMQANQNIPTDDGIKKVPMPNSQRYNFSAFFQDYFPGMERLMVNLKGVLSGGVPITAPRTGYEAGYFRLPAYKRVDLGLSYRLAGGEDAIMDRPFFSIFRNIWLGVDIFNLFDMKNVSSYYWVTDISNDQYAVPNYLTGRQLNVRVIFDF